MDGKGNFLLFAPNPYIHGLIPLISSVFHVSGSSCRVFRVERPTCSERYANDVEG